MRVFACGVTLLHNLMTAKNMLATRVSLARSPALPAARWLRWGDLHLLLEAGHLQERLRTPNRNTLYIGKA